MNLKPEAVAAPSRVEGYLHLTPTGWVRRDAAPYPKDRVETWRYEAERPSDDAKERVRLTRIWHDASDAGARLHLRYGEAVTPSADRNVLLCCHD